MNPLSDRLSQYTPAIFACAMLNLAVAELAAAAGWTWPVQPLLSPTTLAAVHLVTLGWLTLLMFGALFQFVPVIANRPLPSQRAVLWMLLAFELGLAAMVAGFIAAPGRFGALLPLGGGIVLTAVLIGIVDLLAPLVRCTHASLPARFVLAGSGFLLATVLIGLGFALALRVPNIAVRLAPLLAHGLTAHLAAGIGGWFTLTAIGVSYKLLPMFMLAPEERGALGQTVFGASAAGFTLIVAGAGLRIWSTADAAAIVEHSGWTLAGVGVVLYLIDVVRLYRARRRPTLELHNRAALGAFAALALLLPVCWAWRIGWGSAAPLAVVLALGGWLSGLAVTQLYKIVAFLSWLAHFGSRLGRGRVPRVQDLVDERRAQTRFVLFFAGNGVLALGAAIPAPWVFRLGAGVCGLATLLLAREYLAAWRLDYADRAGPPRSTAPLSQAPAAPSLPERRGRPPTGVSVHR